MIPITKFNNTRVVAVVAISDSPIFFTSFLFYYTKIELSNYGVVVMRCRKKLTYEERVVIEKLYNKGVPVKVIADTIDVTFQSVYRELKRGIYDRLTSEFETVEAYSADIAHQDHEWQSSSKGSDLKLQNDYEFVSFVEDMIVNKKYSPAAVLGYIKNNNLKFKTQISLSTLYNYINDGIFINITKADLRFKGKRKRPYNKIKTLKQNRYGKSIEQRPNEIKTRKEFGHWEMDSVIGTKKKGQALLVLTERKTRYELILKYDRTAAGVVKCINKLEKIYGPVQFRKMFKSITVDNGTEFAFTSELERSCRSRKLRTQLYYCHPFCSSERGSNENCNRLIRYWYPKGFDFTTVSDRDIHTLQDWINQYPRKLHNYRTSAELFSAEVGAFL